MNLVQVKSFQSFGDYLAFTQDLVENRRTTGPDQSERMLEYTRLNLHRMQRVAKTMEVLPEIESAFRIWERPLRWKLLTEPWCGDAAQSVPVMGALAGLSDQIGLELLLRDEHLELMDQHLTNGGRAIPKLIIEDLDGNVLATWGPRPVQAQEMVIAYKSLEVKPPYDEFVIELQKWYAKDKTHSVQRELAALMAKL